MRLTDWLLVAIGILMSSAGSILLKVGSTQISHEDGWLIAAKQAIFQWQLITGVFMYLIPVLIWIFLLKKVEISFLQPIFAAVYVFTPIMASIFLNESIIMQRWIGIGIIVLGVFIVAHS
jgi:drug/metabolite transporter (DMT)-like permease